MDGCPLGLGLVVEDKPTEFSYRHLNGFPIRHKFGYGYNNTIVIDM